MEEVESHVNEPPFYFDLIEGAGFCHDATWTLAYALNRTMMGRFMLALVGPFSLVENWPHTVYMLSTAQMQRVT